MTFRSPLHALLLSISAAFILGASACQDKDAANDSDAESKSAQAGFAAPEDRKPLYVTRVTPKGENVGAIRQMVFQFNRPVVPIGRMERDKKDIPVQITPELNCEWRWINTSALACQLGKDDTPKFASAYNIVMMPGITAEDGAVLPKAKKHTFTTMRPRVRRANFSRWEEPGLPFLRISFNQPVSKSSVSKHMSFSFTDENGDLQTLGSVNVMADTNRREVPRYITAPGESYVLDMGEQKEDGTDGDETQPIKGEEARRNWIISPPKALPLNSAIDVHITPGLVSALGPLKGTEDRVAVNFHTFPEFEFLGVRCHKNNGERILISDTKTGQDWASARDKCGPLNQVQLQFTAPVVPSQIKNHVIFTPDLAGGRTDYDPWENYDDYSRLRWRHRMGQTYEVSFPELLKAAETYNVKIQHEDTETQKAIVDEFGRKLPEPVDLSFFTSHRAPNFHLNHKRAVLESQIDSDVPLYITNLDKVELGYKTLTPSGGSPQKTYALPNSNGVKDVQFAVPMKVREMLGGKSGAIYGNISTKPYVDKYHTQHRLFAIVSPYQLHVKFGHFNTLVWVTDLETGAPVKDAKVQIYKDSLMNLSATPERLSQAVTSEDGLASLDGREKLDPNLDLTGWCRKENQDACPRFFVRIDKDSEMALLPLEYPYEVSTYRASNYTVWANAEKQYGHIHSWGTTAQGIYRAGGTIDYKIYVRNQNNEGYTAPPKGLYTLRIKDPTGKDAHVVKDIELSEFGSFSGNFTVPESAPIGWYEFHLSSDFTKDHMWQPLRVLVSDFTPSPFKVTQNLNGDIFHPGDTVDVSSAAQLHSGGPYTDAEIRVTATLKPAYFRSEHPVAAGFNFENYNSASTRQIFQKSGQMDETGLAENSFTLEPQDIVYGHLDIESAVRDERGKYISASGRTSYVGVDRLIGLKLTQWVYEAGQPADIQYIVVNSQGVPATRSKVNLTIERLETKAAKVKGAGNSYVTNYINEWKPAGTCEGISKADISSCSFTPEKPGSYRIIGKVTDTQGREHSVETQTWVSGKGRVVWQEPEDNSLQLIPERTDYKIGETARYLVKNPYPGAKALISIERYGVLKSWVETLEGSTPIIEFEVTKDFMPGFYLSVIVTAPRANAPVPEMGQIDLGKPAFKVGYVKVPVKDPYKQIDVSIETDAKVYKPRDTVTVDIHAEPKFKDKDEPIELAVVVLDEAVLDLVQGGKNYFDPYLGFNKLDGLDVKNYNLLTRLLGRQKFEKKGANPGGDGGSDFQVRSLFKYVSYWNPSITPDENGKAQVNFELPDNLTGWRVLVMAVTPTDRMGLGDANFKVNRPTEVRPVMPNHVTEGDSFQAGFSVMNRTDKTRKLTVRIAASGTVKDDKVCRERAKTGPLSCGYTAKVKLKPYKRKVIYMPIHTGTAPHDRNIQSGAIDFQVTAFDDIDRDSTVHHLPVHKRGSLDTAANYGSFTDDQITESLRFPDNIRTDMGDISVVLSPSVIGNIDGAFTYIRDYDYGGWEAKLSQALIANHYTNLRAYLPEDLTWEDSGALPDQALKQAANYQASNGGMTYFRAQNNYVSPYLSAYTALGFNWLRESGHDVPAPVEEKLHSYLASLLRKDVVPTFYSRGMSSSVRAAALSALSKHGKITRNDLERYRKDVSYMSLFGKSHFLQAAMNIDGADDIAKETAEAILASSIQSAGKFSFNEELDDSYARVLATPMRSNCAILSTFTELGQKAYGQELTGDIPFKLVRTITQTRGNRDHWENTQENVFCMNALVDYARIYEQTAPDMQVNVSVDTESFGVASFKTLTDESVTLRRPITEEDPGAQRTLNVERTGDGRLYYSARMQYAPLDDHAARQNAGIEIRKEYSVERGGKWTLLKEPNKIKRGELIRVDIYLSLPTARNFLIVDDPIPGGLEPVNRDLANTSIVDADKGKFVASGGSWWFQFDDWRHYNASRWSFYHKELRHNAARFYSDYLAAGNYHLSYTAQAIAEGEFSKVPVVALETYDPDIYGKGLPGMLNVRGQIRTP
ncbi:MAG: alpha-2-macroglobulin family protein [Maricaulaceae bacterium]